ncbi:MAG: chorismate mutase [Sphingomonadales bacterium]|jgi:isochorismate pyruvate lyase
MAKQCETMAEVREEIDRVDRAIVELLAERIQYIEQAARIKPERGQVRDQWRVDDVLSKTKKSAETFGAPQELIHMLYADMIEWCINHEFKEFDRLEEGGA